MFENYKFCCEQGFAVHAYQKKKKKKKKEEEEFASCTCMVIPFCRSMSAFFVVCHGPESSTISH